MATYARSDPVAVGVELIGHADNALGAEQGAELAPLAELLIYLDVSLHTNVYCKVKLACTAST